MLTNTAEKSRQQFLEASSATLITVDVIIRRSPNDPTLVLLWPLPLLDKIIIVACTALRRDYSHVTTVYVDYLISSIVYFKQVNLFLLGFRYSHVHTPNISIQGQDVNRCKIITYIVLAQSY